MCTISAALGRVILCTNYTVGLWERYAITMLAEQCMLSYALPCGRGNIRLRKSQNGSKMADTPHIHRNIQSPPVKDCASETAHSEREPRNSQQWEHTCSTSPYVTTHNAQNDTIAPPFYEPVPLCCSHATCKEKERPCNTMAQ